MRRILIAVVKDNPQILDRITSTLRRQGTKIQSLNICSTEDPTLLRLTIVVHSNKNGVQQIMVALDRLIDLIEVQDLTGTSMILSELALVKVERTVASGKPLQHLAEKHSFEVLETDVNLALVQVVDTAKQIERIIGFLQAYGILQITRTGEVAMTRGTDSASPDGR